MNMNNKALVEEFAKFLESKEKPTAQIVCHRSVDVDPTENGHYYFPEGFRVGDVIDFTLTTGEEVSAMAMRQEKDGMLFVFVDCLKDEYPMNDEDTNAGGYEESKLRKVLNDDILNTFPDSIRLRMKAFENGDYLRLLTSKEVFGENYYGGEDNGTQLEPMKNRKNRIALQGKDSEDLEWYWLQNPNTEYASNFVYVSGSGYAYGSSASNSLGVRPAFKI